MLFQKLFEIFLFMLKVSDSMFYYAEAEGSVDSTSVYGGSL